MIDANQGLRIPPAGAVVEHVRNYFNHHPEIDREQFLLEAVQREIRFCEQNEIKSSTIAARGDGDCRWSTAWRPPSAQDIRKGIRAQASLAQRLAMIQYERHGLWPRVRRFLGG